MTTDKQEDRRRQIEAAAFALLEEKGYRSTSMLQIAKRAAASNQTLYAWYGNKQTLFRRLIEDNGHAVKQHLRAALEGEGDPSDALRNLGPLLLAFTTDNKAIILNRAAIADAGETGLLGEAIDSAARMEMVAMITAIMVRHVAQGLFRADTRPEEATECYISLLFGEVMMRQALGRLGPLGPEDIAARAEFAFRMTNRLFAAG